MTIFIALALGDGMAQMAGVCGEGVNLTVYTLYTTVFIYCILYRTQFNGLILQTITGRVTLSAGFITKG